MSDKMRENGQFAFDGLNRVLHEKARLGILSSLMANDQGLLFTELKTLCGLTDGNLSRHLQVLQDAELVEVWKASQGTRSQTLVRMTAGGRSQFMEYISVLERIVQDAQQASQLLQNRATELPGDIGWSTV